MAEIIIGLASFLVGIFLNLTLFQFVYSFEKEVNYFQIRRIFSSPKFPKTYYSIAILFSLVLSLVFLKFYSENLGMYNYGLFLIIFIVLNFFAIFDIKNLEVPEFITVIVPAVLAIVNAVLLFYGRVRDFEFELFGFSYSPDINLLSLFTVVAFFSLIILLTKGEGMGGGDIRIVALIALILGANTILSIYFSVIISLFFSIPYALIVTRKIRGVQIPFVPFLVIGLYLCIAIGLTFEDFILFY